MKRNTLHASILLLLSLLVSAGALAQTSAPKYGINSFSSVVVTSMDLQVDQSTTSFGTDPVNGHRYLTSAGLFYAPVHLPEGARIGGAELEACDDSFVGSVDAKLYRANAAGRTAAATMTTGIGEVSGCSRWLDFVNVPETVDNVHYRYYVEASNVPSNASQTIGAVRVYYGLQVTPAPPFPTFFDVPTNSPIYQFVEALAASGITVGCGGGNFCPNAPLTRGQMAVFLAKALGLHWPAELEDQ